MTWGIHLWNQAEKVFNHTQCGIEHLERFCNFIKDKAIIEKEYSNQIKTLVKKYEQKKKEIDEEIEFSYAKALNDNLIELNLIANQHDFVAQCYQESILSTIPTFVRNLKEERKMHLSEIMKLHQSLRSSVEVLKKMKKLYIEAYKAAEEAQSRYQNVEMDLSIPRFYVDRKKGEAITKQNICEEAKTAYIVQLSKTNELQQSHFTQTLPSVFDKLEVLDKIRINEFKRNFLLYIETERIMLSNMDKSCSNVEKSCEAINAENDVQLVVACFKSDPIIPVDYTFTDMNTDVPKLLPMNNIGLPELETKLSGCKTVEQKLQHTLKQIKIKSDTKAACEKMKSINKDPETDMAIQLEIKKCNEELFQLDTDLKQYEAAIQAGINQSSTSHSNLTYSQIISNEIHSNAGFQVIPILKHTDDRISEQSSKAKDERHLNKAEVSPDDSFDLAFDTDSDAPVTVCKAMYNFIGNGKNTITIKENDELVILDDDSGDGWTKVRNETTSAEGFVPSNYLLKKTDL